MRALTRMRTLAAACALLLFVSGMATAGLGDRVIDRPGTPDPMPPMVGDPDQPTGGMVLIVGSWVIVLRVPLGVLRQHPIAVGAVRRAPNAQRLGPTRGLYAR
jgi:hypothetical protein